MYIQVAALKKQSNDMETNLRKEIVEENVRLNQLLQHTNDEQSKLQLEWRKKQLGKEREHTTQIEAMERAKLQVEEDMHDKVKGIEKESERKVESLREELTAREEELRKKGYAREKEFATKQEAARAEYLQAQEEFQQDMHKKDELFRKQTVQKEQEFQKQLESMLQGKMNAHVQDLQAKLVRKDSEIEGLRKEGLMTQQRSTQQQGVVRDMSAENSSLAAQKEELTRRMQEALLQLQEAQEARVQLKESMDVASAEVDALKRRSVRMDESLAHKDTELSLLGREKDELSSELGLASQTLLKRGDDFSESVRLLQRRLESSDYEAKALHEKLREAHGANSKLTAELDKVSGMLQQGQARNGHVVNAEGDGKQVAALRAELASKELLMETERAAVRRSNSELQNLKSQMGAGNNLRLLQGGSAVAVAEVQVLQQRIDELELYVEEVQPRLQGTQSENDTLTSEMDKVLAENAQIRNELDDLKDHVEASQVHSFMGHAPNMRATQQQHDNHADFNSYLAPGYNPRSISVARDSDERPRRTSGVHGVRLARDVFGAWANFAVDMRGAGRNTGFRCLNHFMDTEGHFAPFMPVGRIRRSELDVRPEKIGSGTFADVYRLAFWFGSSRLCVCACVCACALGAPRWKSRWICWNLW